MLKSALCALAITLTALPSASAQPQASRTPVFSTHVRDAKASTVTVCTRYMVQGKSALEVYCGFEKAVRR
jgi:hypothetical protein